MRVAVLMSTYQGERWLQQQLTSILAQLPPDGRLLIRDDGSTDDSIRIIKETVDPRIRFEAGTNLGFAASFFRLLESVPPEFNVIMLADQDDVWLPGKISRAFDVLRTCEDFPTLYCSRLRMVDENLNVIGESPLPPRGPSFQNALCENIVTGCTVALNRAALNLVLRTGDRRRIYFHDWWIYLVVAAFGQVRMDSTPTLLYRQHASNVVGRGTGLGRYWANLAFIRRRSWVKIMFDQIRNFRDAHGHFLRPDQIREIDRFFDPTSIRSMARLLLIPVRRRQIWLDELLLRAMVLQEMIFGRATVSRIQAQTQE